VAAVNFDERRVDMLVLKSCADRPSEKANREFRVHVRGVAAPCPCRVVAPGPAPARRVFPVRLKIPLLLISPMML
jgi:hypothetical protein